MPVLSRCRDQESLIDSTIRIRIGEVIGSRVKLLIDDPRECLIRREEVPVHATVMAVMT
jgi:sRNA-binding carbon storage regulator CsrA